LSDDGSIGLSGDLEISHKTGFVQILKFQSHIFQAWKVLESDLGPGKSLKCE